MKSKNIFKRIFALLMVLVLCMGLSPVGALAASAGEQMMTFSWNGATYTMYAGQSGSATGMSWSCDTDGNFSMEFTASGTLTILDGDLENAVAKVIGGGGGGSSAYGRVNNAHGGNGGAAGQTVEQSVTVTPGTAYTITVGSGGNGGVPSNTGLASWIDQGVGSNGGTTSAFGLTAQGGAGNGGAAGASGNGVGANGDGNGSGGGGGCLQTFFETDCGNFRGGNYSCFICGVNEGYFDYNVSGWTPLYQNASAPTFAFNGGSGGGMGDAAGGAGGSPQNEHCGGPRDGGAGKYGGGGGGGAYASRVYGIGRGEPQSPTGSATGAGFAGRGGNGGAGIVTLRARVNPNITVDLTKTSANPAMTNGNSCYSLAGAVYGVYSDPDCTQLIETMTTDANGKCSSSSLEKAQYYVKEISPSQGYLLDTRVYTVPAKGGRAILKVTEQPGNDPIGISVTKITDDPASTLPSLEGTQFTIKFYGGQYSSVDELPGAPLRTWVIETKPYTTSSGKTIYRTALYPEYKVSGDDFYLNAAGQVIVPIGTLTVQETTPADGYTTIGGFVSDTEGNAIADADGIILLNVLSSEEISSGGALKFGNEYTKTDKPIYGGVRVQKLDAETGLPTPQGGASFADIPFEIVSLNETEITVDGTVYAKDDVVYSGNSNEKGFFSTPSDLLPAGHYRVDEKAAPDGYLLSGQTSAEFDIVEDGVLVDLSSMDNGIHDKPIRTDFSLLKEDGDTREPMANVLFSITSNTTGESFEFSTDENGRFSSAGSDIHFGADGEGGALIYDSYTVEELPCEANKGYALCEPFTFDAHSAATTIEIVGVKNYAITIDTNASFVDGATDKTQLAFGTVTVKDIVDYNNLSKGLPYRLRTTLWNKTDGELLTDNKGNIVCSETDFTAKSGGSVEARISFNAEGLGGKELVVFEELYPVGRQRIAIREPELLVEHKDINDEKQTVRFLEPRISTSIWDVDTGANISLQADKVTATDTVRYEDIAVNRKYTVYGILVDEASGEPLLDENGHEIESATEFVAFEKDSTVDVTFEFNGNFDTAKKLVAYEVLLYEGTPIAYHADRKDEAQTLWLPKISTSARVPLTDSQLAPGVEELVISDKVKYEGIIPGLEYAVSGQAIDPDTGEIIGGAINRFTPDSEDGVVVNDLKISGKRLSGKRMVIYETILLNGKPVAEHHDPADKDQSVYIPQIITKATGVETESNWIPARDDVHVKDIVGLSNIIPDLEYTVKGEAVLGSDPEKILATAEGTVTATDSSAELALEYGLDASELQGESVVIFETLYYGDIVVASHRDINDAAQTVVVPDIHTEAMVNGKHTATAASKVTLTDIVEHQNLPEKATCRLEGTLMDKETGKPLTDATGSAISAMAEFTPTASDGKAAVSFTFDASALDGKEVVVFEKLYIDDDIQPIAVHEDINDEGQTVKFIKGPITGDESQIALWLAFMIAAGVSAAAIVFAMHRHKKEI